MRKKQHVFIFVGPATTLFAYFARCQCRVASTSISLDSSIASKMMKNLQEKPEGVENEAVEQVHYAVVRAEPGSCCFTSCQVAFADRIILNKCDLVDEAFSRRPGSGNFLSTKEGGNDVR